MLVSGSYHNKIVYCNLMSQVVILPVLVVEPEDVSGVWVVEQLGGRDEIASYERDVCHILFYQYYQRVIHPWRGPSELALRMHISLGGGSPRRRPW